MKIYESKAWQTTEVVVDFFVLNFLWLVCCLPVVTIGPATAALFGVMRGWVRDRDTGGMMAFFQLLRENFVQGLIVSLVWFAIGTLLLLNLVLGARMDSVLRWPSLFLTALTGIVYLLMTPFLFPIVVHYRTSWVGVIRNAFVIAAAHPHLAILALLPIAVSSVLAFLIPIALFLTGSPTACLVYLACARAFRRIDGDRDRDGAPAIPGAE